MDFQILPNWGKRLGLFIFFISMFIVAGDSFMDGYKGVPSGTHHFVKDFLGSSLFYFFDVLTLIGLLIYMLSKEKIEDDYIKLLRLESYQITIIILLIIALIIYLFDVSFQVSLGMILPIFMLLFLITFYFKKRVH
ncbi:hypothetical protein Murru_1244 [Allomuricauda ruestringensis DSM 13258]|uniref:Uncharacterized protein n=1 Tax=Allomuricauda ruestringensis (strain DSM 13258 / CIP 107369 / LMG 19739 / B1) TaxID=886377 RepID=G2PNV2_ALLRU|nr:hypothetical protein [Allomuricauda ruestringensis]AEM70287.1 hypothetical protein Murru_1244 [Allomuricauda ruestringensis DSM 13258]